MPLQSSAEAVAQARRLLGLQPSDEGSAWPVRRLDGQGTYFLVHVTGQLACIDATSGALLASAAAAHAPVAIARESALALASLGAAASAELVWKPCAATLSMFDPLWSVASGGHGVFIDQRGKLWSTLPPKGPGGGPG
jgi:hypothetical protein